MKKDTKKIVQDIVEVEKKHSFLDQVSSESEEDQFLREYGSAIEDFLKFLEQFEKGYDDVMYHAHADQIEETKALLSLEKEEELQKEFRKRFLNED
jgi:hypothetical protein